jgi:hypothetical protein
MQAQAISLADGQGASAVNFHFSPTGLVRGRALRAGGGDQSGIAVVASGAPAVTLTDPLGRFQIPSLPAGAITLVASAPGAGLASAQLTVPWDDELVAPDLQLEAPPEAPGAISGYVQLAGLSAAAGVTVAIAGPAFSAQLTDASGAFQFPGLPPGDYLVTASGPATLEGATSMFATVAQAHVDVGMLTLHPTGTLHGLVRISGKPAAGAVVFAAGTRATAVTGADGTFSLAGAPAGVTDGLQAFSGGAASQFLLVDGPEWQQSASAPALDVSALGPYDPLAATLLLPDGTPAAGAHAHASGAGIYDATADANGAFSMRAVDGLYTLTADAFGVYSASLPAAVMAGGSGFIWGATGPAPLQRITLQAGLQRAFSGAGLTEVISGAKSPSSAVRTAGYGLALTDRKYPDAIWDSEGGSGKLWLYGPNGARQLNSIRPVIRGDRFSAGPVGPQLGPMGSALWIDALFPGPGQLMLSFLDGRDYALSGLTYGDYPFAIGGNVVAWASGEPGQPVYTVDVTAPAQLHRIASNGQLGSVALTSDGGHVFFWSQGTLLAAPSAGCGGASGCPSTVATGVSPSFSLRSSSDGAAALVDYGSGYQLAAADGTPLRAVSGAQPSQQRPGALSILQRSGASDLLLELSADGHVSVEPFAVAGGSVTLASGANNFFPVSGFTGTSWLFAVVGDAPNDTPMTLAAVPASLSGAPVQATANATSWTRLGADALAFIADNGTGTGTQALYLFAPPAAPIVLDPGPVFAASASSGGKVIYVANPPSGPVARMVGTSGAPVDLGPAPWYPARIDVSPDGRIAAILSSGGLAIADLITHTAQLDSGSYAVSTPPIGGVLADGTCLAARYEGETETFALYAARLGTSALQLVRRVQFLRTETAYMAADHSRAIFASRYEAGPTGPDMMADLWSVDASGATLLAEGTDYRIPEGPSGNLVPSFNVSPDGTLLTYRTNLTQNPQANSPYDWLAIGTLNVLELATGRTMPLADHVTNRGDFIGPHTIAAARAFTPAPLQLEDGVWVSTPVFGGQP